MWRARSRGRFFFVLALAPPGGKSSYPAGFFLSSWNKTPPGVKQRSYARRLKRWGGRNKKGGGTKQLTVCRGRRVVRSYRTIDCRTTFHVVFPGDDQLLPIKIISKKYTSTTTIRAPQLRQQRKSVTILKQFGMASGSQSRAR